MTLQTAKYQALALLLWLTQPDHPQRHSRRTLLSHLATLITVLTLTLPHL